MSALPSFVPVNNSGNGELPDRTGCLSVTSRSRHDSEPTWTDTGSGEVKENLLDHDPATKWLVRWRAKVVDDLLTPRLAGEMIDGFVQQYRDGGWVARWPSPGYANLMTGTSSDVSFAGAFLKGITNFDAALRNATVTPETLAGTGRGCAERPATR